MFQFARSCSEDGWFVPGCDIDDWCRQSEVMVAGSGIGNCSIVSECSRGEVGWAADNSSSGKVQVVTT